MINLLVIGLGGFLGAISRYLMSGWVQNYMVNKSMSFFPYGTLAVNILGCLMIGFFSSVFLERQIDPLFRSLINVGFLGALTTFSTFSLETLTLIEDSKYVQGALNIIVSCILGLIAVWFGKLLFKLVWGVR